MSLPVRFAACYLVIFTNLSIFIVKSVSLAAINMYSLLRKVLYNGRSAKICLHNNLPYVSTFESDVIHKNMVMALNRLLHRVLLF